MGTAKAMIDRAREDIGLGEPNYIHKWFSGKVGWPVYNYAWCQAAICKWAYDSGNFDAVMFGVYDAYTVTAAKRFKARGQWISGSTKNTNSAKPGDIVYFDWSGSNDIERVDHVGVVVEALGNGYVKTIEGNYGDRCGYHTRHSSVIAGFGRPNYSGTKETDEMPDFYVSLGSTWKGKIDKGESRYLGWDREYSDKDHQHGGPGMYPSVLFQPSYYCATVQVRIDGLGPEDFGWISAVECKKLGTGKYQLTEVSARQTVVGNDGHPVYVTLAWSDTLVNDRRVRIQAGGFTTDVVVHPVSCKIFGWNR